MVSACSGRPGKRLRSTLVPKRDHQLVVIEVDWDAPRALHDDDLLGLSKSMPMTSAWRTWTRRSSWRKRHDRVGGMDARRRDLGQQRLEHEIIVGVDQLDVDLAAAQFLQRLGR